MTERLLSSANRQTKFGCQLSIPLSENSSYIGSATLAPNLLVVSKYTAAFTQPPHCANDPALNQSVSNESKAMSLTINLCNFSQFDGRFNATFSLP